MKNWTNWLLVLVALVLAALAWQKGGTPLVVEGLLQGGRTLLRVVILLLAAFAVAGLIQALVTEEMATRWLGSESGWRGIALACLGGALMPGGPYVYYPIAAVLFQAGAGIGVLVAFVTAKNLYSVTRLPLEWALLGPQLTITRFAITFVIPPLLGFLAEWLFGGMATRIREGVQP